MLGEGVRAGLDLLGARLRTVCYVEREAAAAAQLVRLMEAGALDSAPVWSDLSTFNAAAWRGCVDWLIAGFPCQDISIAGRRAGLDGGRSGLFFTILDLADDCDAQGLFLENVSAIATATASAVDEAEGELFERAAARVVGELADRGWDAEWITLSASDVGASHGRSRWFCFAWRAVADADQSNVEGWWERDRTRGRQESPGHARLACGSLFAPGPLDPRWPALVADRPDLAPAVEPGVRMLADGMAHLVDESRAHQLRQVGNGVVPLQAAAALVELLRRATSL